ncbi:MAG: uroporphyrinogen decarboxylase family protein [Armatimonadota bacterium]|jgi:uroporphyrinogen decarboxylase
MTPRDTAITALQGGRPDGLVPHLELVFQLTEQVFGQKGLRGEDLKDLRGPRRTDALKRNAELWVRVAETYDWSVITGPNWLPPDEQCETFEYIREIAGDTYLLSAFCDGTYAIPDGETMSDHVAMLFERPEEAREKAEARIADNARVATQLIEAGAQVVFMCADYCFNTGPFLSPPMFAEFVTPYLERIVTRLHEAGEAAGRRVLCVKHTDGDILPILDQLVSTGIDALHSIDPQAGVDIAEVRRRVGDRVCLIGNVECAALQSGTPDQIRDSALYALEHGGVDGGGYIFASSNCIFQGVPIENYDAMLRVRQEYGYPGANRPVEDIAPPIKMGEREMVL